MVVRVSRPATRKLPRATREVMRTDRRWLLVSAIVLLVLVALSFAALAVYHWTGPHPRITLLLRQLRALARWIIPRHGRARSGWW